MTRTMGWLLLATVPAMAGLLENGDFAAGERGWGTWSATPERLQFAVVDGAAKLTITPGAPASGCMVAAMAGLDVAHRYSASVRIDAADLTAGQAVLRVEFWGGGGQDLLGRAESAPVTPGRSALATADFEPPAGTSAIKVTGYLVDAVGSATFDDFKLVDHTGPVIRPVGSTIHTAGEPAVATLEVVNGTANPLAGAVAMSVRQGAREVATQRADLALAAGAEQRVTVNLGALPAGEYTLRWSAAGGGGEQTIRVLDPPRPPFDRYGGWAAWSGQATGYFHTAQLDGRWWLIDPAGRRFFSTGVNGVNEQGTGSPSLGYSPYRRSNSALYENDTAWAANTVTRLRLWGFNTLGSWSSRLAESAGMPYSHNLDIGRRATNKQMTQVRAGHSPWSWFPDVFDPEFAAGARRVAQTECGPRKDDPLLVGYFLDNEFSWDGLWDAAFTTAPNSACRDAFVACAQKLFGSADELRKAAGPGVATFDELRRVEQPLRGTPAWRDAWLEAVSEQYYSVTVAAVRAADPNHLVISQRYAGWTPDPSAKAAGRHCDVVCMNFYNDGTAYGVSENLQRRFTELGELTGKPMLIGEWSYKAMDSGLPNTKGAATPVETQQDRAIGYASFVATAAANPHIVGAHWFIFSDQPLEGRSDGENSNYGLVDQTDRPYPELVVAASFMNRFLYRLANAAKFGQTPVEILSSGPAWVRARGDGFALNDPALDARFSARDEQLGGQLRIGLPGGGPAEATWREGDVTVTATAPTDTPRSYRYHRGETVLDGAMQAGLPAVASRPYVTLEPALLPAKAARYPVTLTVHNPTAERVSGDWEVVPSPGWLLEPLPTIDVAPGATVRLQTILTAPAGSMTWPRLAIWKPFIDLVVWRVGAPIDLVALPGSELLVRRHGSAAGQAKLTVASEPAGLSGSFDLDWQDGQSTVRVSLTGALPAGARGARLTATYGAPGAEPVRLAARLYDLGGDLSARPNFALPEGAEWLADPGAIRLRRTTPGTIDCAFPALPLEPGHGTVVVKARARWQDVVRGTGEPWHRANVAVYFNDAAGEYLSHVDLLLGHDSSDWRAYSQAVRVPAGAASVTVHARMLECTGELWVDDLAVIDCPAELSREVGGIASQR